LGETPGCRHRYIIICFPKYKGSADHKACTSPLRHSQRDKNQTKTDGSSKNGISAILYQKHTQDWKPIAYASRYPTPTEANYHPIEMEMLAIVWGYEKMSKYNHGLPDVTLETDHKLLIPIVNNKPLHDMLMKFTKFINGLILKGEKIVIPTALRQDMLQKIHEGHLGMDDGTIVNTDEERILPASEVETDSETEQSHTVEIPKMEKYTRPDRVELYRRNHQLI